MRWFGWVRRRSAAESAAEGASVAVIGGRLRKIGIPYVLPADLEEMNRLDFQHYLLRQVFHGNYAAPIQQPRDILDVGAGTGQWAREMATLFPTARVVGLDVTVPPADERAEAGGREVRPPNYTFVAGNVLEGLPFPDASFDFVHMRLLVLAIPHDRWPFVVGELARVTRPGGWVESVEATTLENGGPEMDLFMRWIVTLLARRGINFPDGGRVGELLRAARLSDIVSQRVTLPFGDYGGRTGKLLMADFFNGVQAYGGLMEAQGIATAAEFERVVAEARAAVAAPNAQCVSPFHIAYGRRLS
ncbi:MAG TPA: class I SAM-dependent methyltransferase [Ktedonobacterales bacterium]|jgi:ubiquinone/menaquinone biosynthesis C-methylase UbiE|nr:class I SAM-dependent methyltransferase [Ktedonobacterales bacterium]